MSRHEERFWGIDGPSFPSQARVKPGPSVRTEPRFPSLLSSPAVFRGGAPACCRPASTPGCREQGEKTPRSSGVPASSGPGCREGSAAVRGHFTDGGDSSGPPRVSPARSWGVPWVPGQGSRGAGKVLGKLPVPSLLMGPRSLQSVPSALASVSAPRSPSHPSASLSSGVSSEPERGHAVGSLRAAASSWRLCRPRHRP